MTWFKQRASGWSGLVALAFVAVVTWLALKGLPDGRLHVFFLDVGQGDAILVVAPDGRQILIDGGPSPTALLKEVGAILPFWDHDLDLVVLTHPDADHLTGLVGLLDGYRVRQALDTQAADSAPLAKPWREGLARGGIRPARAEHGMQLIAGDLRLTVLNPGPAAGQHGLSDNNGAIVLRVDYGKTSFLLTGDIEGEAETALLSGGIPLKTDVLKVAHHGGERSTSAAFLAAVRPSLAVIQVGADNRFGHPHPDVLGRLAGSRILRTDRDGRVEIISDGSRLEVRTEQMRVAQVTPDAALKVVAPYSTPTSQVENR